MNSSNLTLATEQIGQGFHVAQFKSSELAFFSYYIQSQHECALIDPVFDVQAFKNYIKERKSELKYVMLTHYQADYISGHTQIKVPIIMGPAAFRQINTFKMKECVDNQVLYLGRIKIKIIHTPGHTIQSSCYQLIDAANKDAALFSGDTIFLGEVGRPDLSSSQKITKEDLASMLYDSVQKIKKLDGKIRVYPAHGSGSACGKSIGEGNYSTLETQKQKNQDFKFQSKEEFVKEKTDNLPKPPKYFFHVSGLNQKGPSSYDQLLKKAHIPLDTTEFLKINSVIKLVDTRNDLGKGLIKGSYWLPYNGPIVNFIPNFISHEQDFIILTQKGKQLDIIIRFLRIGYFNIKGYVNFDISELKEDFVQPSIIKFKDLKNIKENCQHVDVRNRQEYQKTGVVQKATLIPLSQIQKRVQELRGCQNIVINCLSGMRSKVAWSILTKHNISAKVLAEEFKQFKNQGFNIVKYKS